MRDDHDRSRPHSTTSTPGHPVHAMLMPFLNAFHSRDGWTAVAPQEIILSGIVVLILAVRPWGRPVGLAVDRFGALPLADDTGNTAWRVTAR